MSTALWAPMCRFLLELREDEALDHTGFLPSQVRQDLRTFFVRPGKHAGKRVRHVYRGLVRAVERLGIGYCDAAGYLVITDWRPIEDAAACGRGLFFPAEAGAR